MNFHLNFFHSALLDKDADVFLVQDGDYLIQAKPDRRFGSPKLILAVKYEQTKVRRIDIVKIEGAGYQFLGKLYADLQQLINKFSTLPLDFANGDTVLLKRPIPKGAFSFNHSDISFQKEIITDAYGALYQGIIVKDGREILIKRIDSYFYNENKLVKKLKELCGVDYSSSEEEKDLEKIPLLNAKGGGACPSSSVESQPGGEINQIYENPSGGCVEEHERELLDLLKNAKIMIDEGYLIGFICDRGPFLFLMDIDVIKSAGKFIESRNNLSSNNRSREPNNNAPRSSSQHHHHHATQPIEIDLHSKGGPGAQGEPRFLKDPSGTYMLFYGGFLYYLHQPRGRKAPGHCIYIKTMDCGACIQIKFELNGSWKISEEPSKPHCCNRKQIEHQKDQMEESKRKGMIFKAHTKR